MTRGTPCVSTGDIVAHAGWASERTTMPHLAPIVVWPQRWHPRDIQPSGLPPQRVVTVSDPALGLQVGGRSIRSIQLAEDRYLFVLPTGTRLATLTSRLARPPDFIRHHDGRTFGVAVGGIMLTVGQDVSVHAADHLPAGSGWHLPAVEAGALWRWTDGAGELLFDALPEPGILVVKLSRTAAYIVPRPAG